MVMRPDPRVGALTAVRRRNFGPWWLWTVVVVLALVGGYASYIARFSNERLTAAAEAYNALAAQRDKLNTALNELDKQLQQATMREEKSRGDADAVSAVAAKLQKHVDSLEVELAAAQKQLEESKKNAEQSKADAEQIKTKVDELRAKAARADEAFEQVRNLQERASSLKEDIKSARAQAAADKEEIVRLKSEVAAAKEAKSALEREVATLKGELGELQRKLATAPTAAAAPPAATSAAP